ncbi:MAG: S8 family serine peptidase [Candidatus Eisenbacteria bacterium]|uniref:S8 family serine peptidase n=1 Tax=Eiseniibacteriota bacterium TaxID=2212470 RepID=A0A849SLM9_UNCEI|nr:S8 family serine peptidase [Candidatus Eisenbacteria bacterium]
MRRGLPSCAVFVALLALAGAARASEAPRLRVSTAPSISRSASLARLDARLLDEALAPSGVTLPVWVEFVDKGESGDPGELARRLSDARARLSPRALARRLRAHLNPLVDYADLPVHAPYLAQLAEHAVPVLGWSRWMNSAAVRIPGERLLELAALPAVARVRASDPLWLAARVPAGAELVVDVDASGPPPARVRGAGGLAGCTGCEGVDYGTTFAQLERIRLPALHDSGYTGAGVLICVLDDGFNYFDKHEATRDHVIALDHQRDFVRGQWGVQDTSFSHVGFAHGSWTFGSIAGRKFGTYVGAAFDASFALARTENTAGERPIEMAFWGLGAEWADSLGADIISSSLGYFQFDSAAANYVYADMDGRTTIVSRAAEIAASKGILIVNAVGNEGQTPWGRLIAPSDVNGDSLIAVGAVDASGQVAAFSSYGPSADDRIKPEVCAHGVSNRLIATTGNPNAYTNLSGTSFAAPLIAGAAACLMQARPAWTPRDVARALRSTASHPQSPDARCGYGIANAVAALNYDPTTGIPIAPRPSNLIALRGAHPHRADDGAVQWTLMAAPRAEAGERVRVRVSDALGRAVITVHDAPRCLQALPITWDGRDAAGRPVPSGLYFVVVETARDQVTQRLVMLR